MQTQFISASNGFLGLIGFAVAMFLVTQFFARRKDSGTREGFLVAGRDVNWFIGGCSIAASWIWAPALFISCQIAYEKGCAGLFWFMAPNVLALALFGLLAPAIRQQMPSGYTLPQYMQFRYGGRRIHRLYLCACFFYEVMAVTVQLFAGGNFVSLLTGIPLMAVMPILAIIALGYTWASGLEASVITDFVQMGFILLVGSIVIPLTFSVAGGTPVLQSGLAGINGTLNIFDPEVAFSFGIVTSIGLISGAVVDQQYWQRSFAIKASSLRKAYLFGAVLFAIVPLGLSILGFIAASPSVEVTLPAGIDVSLIGVQTVATLLPAWAVFAFVLMLLCGLSSTIDSGLTAAGSLWVTDVMDQTDEKQAVQGARLAMLGISIIGLLIAVAAVLLPGFGLKHLWWLMNAIASCLLVPTILSLFVNRVGERGASLGILLSLTTGVPWFIYGSYLDSAEHIVSASVYILLVNLMSCLFIGVKQNGTDSMDCS